MPKATTQAAMSIGELARQTGASLRSIRHYDDHQLLSSVQRRRLASIERQIAELEQRRSQLRQMLEQGR